MKYTSDDFRWSITPMAISVSMIVDNRLAIAELSHMKYVDLPEPTDRAGHGDFEICFFSRINVPRQIRGKGIGSALLDELLAYCKSVDISVLCDVNAYGDWTEEETTEWYIRHGFKKQLIDDVEALWFNADKLEG